VQLHMTKRLESHEVATLTRSNNMPGQSLSLHHLHTLELHDHKTVMESELEVSPGMPRALLLFQDIR
jgi:hypothetical protein